jgi:hypothetical protein
VNRTLSLLIFLALATNGIQMLWAGHFPLPNRRHAGQPPFVIAMFLLPILLTAALWRASGAILKSYLVGTLILLAVMVSITSGNIVDTTHIRGLTQRLYTLAVFPVMGVSAIVLARRYKAMAAGRGSPGRSPSDGHSPADRPSQRTVTTHVGRGS